MAPAERQKPASSGWLWVAFEADAGTGKAANHWIYP